MHPQLESIRNAFIDASSQLAGLAAGSDSDEWNRAPVGGGWSAAECVAHLNIASSAYLKILPDAIRAAESITHDRYRYRRKFMGWLLWFTTQSRPLFRLKTTPSLIPGGNDDRDDLLARFDQMQDRQIALVEQCEGLRIDKVIIRSPFDERIRYDVYSALTIIPSHQMRHLLQAERALTEDE